MPNFENLRLRSRLLALSLAVTLGILAIGAFALSMAEESNVTMESNAAAAHQLETLANDLRQTVAYFRTA